MIADSCRKQKTHLCQFLRRAVFAISLSTAALHLRAGGLIFTSTGSQGDDS